MKYKITKITLLGAILIAPLSIFSQSTLDSLLSSVSKNNKEIIAYNQFLEAKKIEFKTGLSLDNPTFEYDFMQGTPANAGNQTDITAVQTFDFPTTYAKKKSLSNVNIEKLDILSKAHTQTILLEVKSNYLNLIYLNKRNNALKKRLDHARILVTSTKFRLEKGDASILDLNKAKTYQITVINDVKKVEHEILATNNKLTELNGDIEFAVSDTIYPPVANIDTLEEILKEAVMKDFKLKSIQQDLTISNNQVELNKAMALPKLEVGYRHQAILGQKFNGFHAGISIPLFENKNKVKAARAQSFYYELLEESHKIEHHSELETKQQKAIILKESVAEFEKLLSSLNTETILKKSLDAGEISAIEYFMELRYYQQTYDDFWKMELEYQLEVAELMSYRL